MEFENKENPSEQDTIDDYRHLFLSLKAIGSGIWDYDIVHDLLNCNAQWYSILRIPDDYPRITTRAAFREMIHPEDAARATAVDFHEIRDLMARDERYHIEFRIIRPDGNVRWIRSVACLVETEAGMRAIGCITDITEYRSRFISEGRSLQPHDYPEFQEGQHILAEGTNQAAKNMPLTRKERECLQWVSIGKTAWETAAILGLSRRTIEFHLHNATRKLQASNKLHAAVIAIRSGWL